MEKQKPLKVFRQGMIAASVWARTGRRGAYGEFTLSRTFRDGEAFKYASTYRTRDIEALKAVISEAVAWMQGEEAGFSKATEEGAESSEGGEHATTVNSHEAA